MLPDDNFPTLQAADYNSYDLQVMPSDPQLGEAWLDEGNTADVQTWLADLGHQTAYVVVSRSMRADAHYFGAPRGYERLSFPRFRARSTARPSITTLTRPSIG